MFHSPAPENEGCAGRTVGEIATERGQDPWDALCDIALADDLETSFGNPAMSEPDADWEARVEICRDPRAVIGASRLYAEAEGIEHVICNGTEIVSGGQFTGARPGTLLRSGQHTTGPSLN